MNGRRLLKDLGFSFPILYASVWIYELSNYFVLKALGDTPRLVMQNLIPIAGGLLPIATALNSSATLPIMAEPIVIVLAIAFSVPLYLVAKKHFGKISEIAAISCVSVFLGGFFWELLSSVPIPTGEMHIMVSSTLAGVAEGSILKLTSRKGSQH